MVIIVHRCDDLVEHRIDEVWFDVLPSRDGTVLECLRCGTMYRSGRDESPLSCGFYTVHIPNPQDNDIRHDITHKVLRQEATMLG